MRLSIAGINPGIICHQNKFSALALKIKHPKNKHTLLFFPLVALKDFLLALEHRLALQARSAGKAKEEQRKHIDSTSKNMLEHIPELEESEIQPADIGQRVNKVILRENTESELVFIFLLHSGEQIELSVNEYQVELLVTAIIHATNNSGMRDIAISISSLLDFLPLFDADFMEDGNISYDTYSQDEWKQTLFSHHQALIYQYTDESGQTQYSGTIIKTRNTADNDEMASISRRVLDYSHRLNKLKGKPSQVSVKTLAAGKHRMLTLEQCMRGLHLVQQQVKQEKAAGK